MLMPTKKIRELVLFYYVQHKSEEKKRKREAEAQSAVSRGGRAIRRPKHLQNFIICQSSQSSQSRALATDLSPPIPPSSATVRRQQQLQQIKEKNAVPTPSSSLSSSSNTH